MSRVKISKNQIQDGTVGMSDLKSDVIERFSGLDSAVAARIPSSSLGTAGGPASLGADGRLMSAQSPDAYAFVDCSVEDQVYVLPVPGSASHSITVKRIDSVSVRILTVSCPGYSIDGTQTGVSVPILASLTFKSYSGAWYIV
jgi:hypothetical protein